MDFGVDNQVLRSFQQEVRNYLPVIWQTARDTQADGPRLETVRELARTIGSAASVLGLAELHDAAGQLERGLETRDASGDDTLLSALACLEQFSLEEIEVEEPVDFNPDEFELWPEEEAEAEEVPAAPVEGIDEILSEEMLEVYQMESEEHLGFVAQHLAELEQDPSRRDLVQEVRRSIHTLKGAAAMVGLRTAGALAKRAQDFLDQVCDGAIHLTPEVLTLTTNVATTLDKLARAGVPDAPLKERAAALKAEMGVMLERGAEDISRLAQAVAPEPAQPPIQDRADDVVSDELLEVFQEEADEQLETAMRCLRALEQNADERDALQELRRAVHTLKGAAGMVGLNTASSLAHRAEDLLDQLFERGEGPGPEALQLLFATTDMLQDLAKAGVPGEDMLTQARQLREAFGALPATGAAPATSEPQPAAPAESETDQIISDEMLEVYQTEAEEHLGLVAQHLRGLETEPNNRELIQEVRRSVHTLKGAAGMVGLRTAGKLAHRAEDYLDEVFDGKRTLTQEALRLLFETADALDDLARAGLPDEALRARAESLKDRFGRVLAEAPVTEAPAPEPDQPAPIEAATAPEPEAEAEAPEPYELFEAPEPEIELAAAAPAPQVEPEPYSAPTVEVELAPFGERTDAAAPAPQDEPEPESARAVEVEPAPFGERTEGEAAAPEPEPAPVSAPEPQTEVAEVPPPPKPQPERKPPVRVTQSTPPARPAAASVEHSASGQFVRVPIERVDELVRMVAELVVHRSTLEQQYSRYSRELGEHDLTTGRLRRLAVRLEDDFAARALMAVQSTHPTDGRRALTPDPVQGAAGEFDELEFDRYSEFHLLSRDVTETASDLVSAGVQLRSVGEDFRQALHRFGRVTGGVQDLLMRMRMMQVGSIETRLHRTVRVAATKRSKNVRFTVVGADVELDKTLLAEMTGPLEHILRNAVDHGLESPAERVKAGKPVQGAITLEASLDGHRALLRISDDGKGLNPAKIRTRAIEMGRYSSAQVDDMADEELFELVFQPGFTTAEEVSEISGRGVGLDAVRAAVNKLGGSISITSELGKGATFVIGLPTSLAVTRVLLVQAGGRRFCMPAHAVDKVARGKITPGDGERRATVEVDGRRLPAYRLTDALHLAAEQQAEREQPILVVEAGERRYALAVDEVMEARDAVVKALGPLLSGAAGISAATVLGDGSVALILNPAELPDAEAKIAVRGPRPVQESGLHVLMADDSISVRRVLMKTFESAGWRFTAARDGKDALEKLRELDHPPDVALLDVEMPKMDGFQLTSALRAMPEYADLPIVMLTSRAGEKHRRKAQELGANDYLVKPYIEDVLLGALRRAARRKPAA